MIVHSPKDGVDGGAGSSGEKSSNHRRPRTSGTQEGSGQKKGQNRTLEELITGMNANLGQKLDQVTGRLDEVSSSHRELKERVERQDLQFESRVRRVLEEERIGMEARMDDRIKGVLTDQFGFEADLTASNLMVAQSMGACSTGSVSSFEVSKREQIFWECRKALQIYPVCGPALKRNIKLDDESMGVVLDFSEGEGCPWKRIRPDQVRTTVGANPSIRRGPEEISASDIGNLVLTGDAGPLTGANSQPLGS